MCWDVLASRLDLVGQDNMMFFFILRLPAAVSMATSKHRQRRDQETILKDIFDENDKD